MSVTVQNIIPFNQIAKKKLNANEIMFVRTNAGRAGVTFINEAYISLRATYKLLRNKNLCVTKVVTNYLTTAYLNCVT